MMLKSEAARMLSISPIPTFSGPVALQYIRSMPCSLPGRVASYFLIQPYSCSRRMLLAGLSLLALCIGGAMCQSRGNVSELLGTQINPLLLCCTAGIRNGGSGYLSWGTTIIWKLLEICFYEGNWAVLQSERTLSLCWEKVSGTQLCGMTIGGSIFSS